MQERNVASSEIGVRELIQTVNQQYYRMFRHQFLEMNNDCFVVSRQRHLALSVVQRIADSEVYFATDAAHKIEARCAARAGSAEPHDHWASVRLLLTQSHLLRHLGQQRGLPCSRRTDDCHCDSFEPTRLLNSARKLSIFDKYVQLKQSFL
jgi:hypothetical protein